MIADHLVVLNKINHMVQTKHGGKPLYVVLSGSHLFGFPSVDSDFDYRGVFLAKTNKYLGLNEFPEQFRYEEKEPELDVVYDELKFACKYLLTSNCNQLEHLFGTPLISTPEHHELRKIIKNGGMSRTGVATSYIGMAHSNYTNFIIRQKSTSSKKYLYVFRGLLSGIHALKTGNIEPNITITGKDYPEIMELVEFKKSGKEWENIGRVAKYDKVVDDLFKEFNDAETRSNLPDEQDIDIYDKLDDWVKKQRKKYLD